MVVRQTGRVLRAERVRTLRPTSPLHVGRTLSHLRRGSGDPTYRTPVDGTVWRGVRTPDGPATLRIDERPRDGVVRAAAWGAGAEWVLDGLPDLVGESDDASGFDPGVPLLRRLATRFAGWRVPRSGQVMEALIPAVLEQKVTSIEAWRSWRELVWWYGERAPGPTARELRLWVPPTREAWRSIPVWQWHRAGVGPERMRTIQRLLPYAGRLEETLEMPRAEGDARLRALPGVGAWTAAETRQRAHGDADAVSVGDVHMAKDVGWVLTGERLDDDGVLEVLERWRGHRFRVTRMIEMAGLRAPRRAPRFAPRDYRAI